MLHYRCSACDYYYDPDENSGLEFEDIGTEWTCPVCGADKDQFIAEEDHYKEPSIEDTDNDEY